MSGKWEKTTSWSGSIYKAILSIAVDASEIHNKINKPIEISEKDIHKDPSESEKLNLFLKIIKMDAGTTHIKILTSAPWDTFSEVDVAT